MNTQVFRTKTVNDTYQPQLAQQVFTVMDSLGVDGNNVIPFQRTVGVNIGGPCIIAPDFQQGTGIGAEFVGFTFNLVFTKKSLPIVTVPVSIDDDASTESLIRPGAYLHYVQGASDANLPLFKFRYPPSSTGQQPDSSIRQGVLFDFDFDQVSFQGSVEYTGAQGQLYYFGAGIALIQI